MFNDYSYDAGLLNYQYKIYIDNKELTNESFQRLKIQPQFYGYQDSYIRLSRAIIQKGYVLQMPRIEFLYQDITIKNIEIQDQDGKVLAIKDYLNVQGYYSDLRTVYYETPATNQSVMGKGPYQLKITYYNQNHTLESRAYPLTSYENHMS